MLNEYHLDQHNRICAGTAIVMAVVRVQPLIQPLISTYKGNAENCDPRYSFHWTGTDNTLYLFEAPIDLSLIHI